MNEEHHARLRLFALKATAELGNNVAKTLGVALAAHEERDFEDGERDRCGGRGIRGCRLLLGSCGPGQCVAADPALMRATLLNFVAIGPALTRIKRAVQYPAASEPRVRRSAAPT